MVSFGIVFLTYSVFSFSQAFVIASLLVLIGGAIVMHNGLISKKYLFVCGECNLTFLEESALRKHYGIEHTKKG